MAEEAVEELQAFVPGELGADGERVCCNVVAGDPELQCNICKYVMEDPMFLGCCGKYLCHRCEENIKKARIQDMRRCPFCQKSFTSLLNQSLQGRVNRLRVKCPNDSKGCSWQGQLNEVMRHITPRAEAGKDGCPFQVMRCRHQECTAEILRKDLPEHEKQLCDYRTYTCKFCLDVTDTYHKVSTDHFPVCPEYTVPCPNKDCSDYMIRSAVEEHLSTACQYHKVACDYASAGCNMAVLRKNMQSHYETSSHYHNKLLLNQNAALQVKLVENEQQLLKAIQQHAEQNSKLEECLRQQDLKHQQQLSLLRVRMDEVAAKSEAHMSAAKAANMEQDFAGTMMRLENNFASENNQLRNDIAGVTSEIFVLKDSQDEMKKTLDEAASKGEIISQVRRDCQKLSDSLEAFKLHGNDRIDLAVVEQIRGPALCELGKKVTDNQSLVSDIWKSLDYVERCITPQPPFAFTVSRFSDRKFNKEPFVSSAFYTHRRGYKMCVRVDLRGMSNHVALHCCIMRGEHDETLAWPFRGDVHVRIQNQLGDHAHYLQVVKFDDTTGENKSRRVSTGDKNYLHGFNQFISHQQLGLDDVNRCQYLKGDAVDFEVLRVDVQS